MSPHDHGTGAAPQPTAAGAETLPLVTAALVCWNHRPFVRAAVLSALQQDYPRLEVIVIDNGSTDGSVDELRALHEQHEFTLIVQQNVGLVRALNQALSMARGKYFATLATDDVWLPGKTRLQVSFMEHNPGVDLVGAQMLGIDADGSPVDRDLRQRVGETTFSDLMIRGCSVQGPTVMCRVDALRAMGGYDESIRIEDYTLALRMTHEKRRVVVLDEVVTRYRVHGGSWTARPIKQELTEIGKRFRHTPEYVGFYRHHFGRDFWHLVRDGEKRSAWRMLRTEPVPWTPLNIRGLLRMLIPYSMIRAYRALKGQGTKIARSTNKQGRASP